MRIIHAVFLLSGLWVILPSCRKTSPLDATAYKQNFVLNAFLHRDSVVRVRVTNSSNTYTTRFEELENPTVLLFENNEQKELLHPVIRNGRTYYESRYLPQPGNTYRISAAAGGRKAEGEDKLPVSFSLSTVNVTHTGAGYTRYTFTITTEIAARNYFRFRLLVFNVGTNTYDEKYFAAQASNGPGELNDLGQNVRNYFYEGALFNGNQVNIVMDVGRNIEEAVLEVSALTEHSFAYLRTLYVNAENEGSLGYELRPVYTNVNNGLGIVGGIQTQRVVVR